MSDEKIILSDDLDIEPFDVGVIITRRQDHGDGIWREQYRPHRPELEPVMWTIRISEYLVPMPKIKTLIEICEKHGLVFWMGQRGDGEYPELYVKIARPGSGAEHRF